MKFWRGTTPGFYGWGRFSSITYNQDAQLGTGFIYALLTNFPIIPERVVTSVLIIASLRKAFPVLGLIPIRAAISLLVRARARCCTALDSRLSSGEAGALIDDTL
jgi:hypothetical protein